MESLLMLKNVSKSMGGRKIINKNNLVIQKGEVFGFLGPNGAGKTTTIKMILGLLSIDEGDILIDGFSIRKKFEKAMACVTGIVENPEMYNYLSGYDNLRIYARARKVKSKDRIDEVVKLVGLENRIQEKVKNYSLGMRQRLAIALCMLDKPKLIVLDEPTNGLDPAGIKEMRDLLRYLAHEEGTTVFISSHLMSEMEQMCDRVGFINRGAILGVMKLEDLMRLKGEVIYRIAAEPVEAVTNLINSNLSDIIVGANGNEFDFRLKCSEDASKVLKMMLDNNITVYSFAPLAKSLEDIFIEITGGGNIIA